MTETTGTAPESADAIRELAARSAVLVGRLFEIHGWTYGWRGGEHVVNVEEIAETFEELFAALGEERDASTGRLMVMRTGLGLETYLHLGTLFAESGSVDVDDLLAAPPIPDTGAAMSTDGDVRSDVREGR